MNHVLCSLATVSSQSIIPLTLKAINKNPQILTRHFLEFVTVTVTDTVCAPPPAGPPTHATGTTTQAPGNPPAPTITTTTSVTSVGTAPGTTGDGPGTTVSETTATGIPLSTENSLVSSETHGIPGTGTQSPSASTVSSGRPSSTHPTSSQSSGHAVTPTSTSSGSHPTSAAPNEAVARGGMHNALLILAATFVGFFMI
jgi:hypothetical protein